MLPRLKEQQKNYREAKKSQYNNEWNSFFNCDFYLCMVINKIVF